MVEKAHTTGLWPSLTDPLRAFGQRLAEWVAPAAEATANGDVYRVSVELPGVSEDDVEITLDNDVLTMKGEKTSEREEKGDTWFFTERQYGAFQRSFRMPPDADPDKVSAEMKDGVLTVSVCKRDAQKSNAKSIKITRG
ncbi:Hsp20/alpha crystallin family protein [Frigidibacter sp. ROC022]|uniref:Hsp20/alpha crystallin family protein n=1 Tax=Frigidibacter sp. ROC022 TaxID=2971796 RepID=UPI00215A29A1|nr:Hsp20/alpha crystallin family protein [Frigidibacter sp. ROC022]MCR8722876.1 Hsp20/alpha crystallin family protein [Frigidibacter sp. ROC022]